MSGDFRISEPSTVGKMVVHSVIGENGGRFAYMYAPNQGKDFFSWYMVYTAQLGDIHATTSPEKMH